MLSHCMSLVLNLWVNIHTRYKWQINYIYNSNKYLPTTDTHPIQLEMILEKTIRSKQCLCYVQMICGVKNFNQADADNPVWSLRKYYDIVIYKERTTLAVWYLKGMYIYICLDMWRKHWKSMTIGSLQECSMHHIHGTNLIMVKIQHAGALDTLHQFDLKMKHLVP